MRQAAAAVTVGTHWAWEPTAIRCGLHARRSAQREEMGGGILWRPLAYSLFINGIRDFGCCFQENWNRKQECNLFCWFEEWAVYGEILCPFTQSVTVDVQ